jgi:methyl-accepting chemotaxis protein
MTLVVPILSKTNEFIGIVATDISSETIQSLIYNNKIFEGKGEVTIVSNNGTIVASSNNKGLIGKNISIYKRDLKNKINKSFKVENKIDNDTLSTLVPINFGSSNTPWYVNIDVPLNYLTEGVDDQLLKLSLFGFLFLVLLLFVTSYLIGIFVSPVQKITRVAQKVAIGNLDVWDVQSNSLEIEQLNKAFKQVIDSQKDITEVTKAIANGDYSKKAIVKSEYDQLSISVNQMIENLQRSTEEDKKRKWSNEGYAEFAELLRKHDNLNALTYNALRYLIKYTNCNQGGVFLLEEEGEKTYLKLISYYAYGRQKFIQKIVNIGEGLVGQCFIEKETTIITDIPQDYLAVTSGLGEANPTFIILLPLINNEKIEGVIEIASFHELEQYQIEFLEKCCNSLASVITSVRVNELTAKLLEEAQIRAEQMKMQEEEMRQNMEELAATQEELRRREEGYLEKIAELQAKLSS